MPGDSFAWQQVGNLQCQCSVGRLASSKCWICLPVQCWSMVRLAGAADFQHLAVARSAFFQDLQLDLCADSAGQGVARSVLPSRLSWNVAALSGDSFAWQEVGNLHCECSMQHGQDSAAWLGWLQICNILQWPHLFCNQDLQLEPCADWCSWAASGSDLGWFDQCSWLLST